MEKILIVVDYSLILLDVVMPDMDGFTLLKKLQEELITQSIPVILITSLSDVSNEQHGLILGAVDYITKPSHRRRFDRCSTAKWHEAVRMQVPLSICMFDIDHFKAYNDTFGHPAGDKVIAAVAKTISAHLKRTTDFVARYGGEEFVALSMGDPAEKIFGHLKKIRQAVEDLHIPHAPSISQWVTVSAGGVTVVPSIENNYAFFLKAADTMLYDAKRYGRNQVVWADGQLTQMLEK